MLRLNARLARVACAALLSFSAGCGFVGGRQQAPEDVLRLPWEDLVRAARGSAIRFAMWTGEEDRNRYFRTVVARDLKQQFGLELEIVPYSDTADVVNKLLNEKAAKRNSGGSIDVVWINGENFRSAKQGMLLWGPFAEALPNIRYYDESIWRRDFGTLTSGFEAPWQRAQFVMAYDSARLAKPPVSIENLAEWINDHPGRFTYIAPPNFTGSAFLRHILLHFGNHDPRFWRGFDERLYRSAAAPALGLLNELEPKLWRAGQTYPATQQELERLFVNNEVDFAMSYGPAFASLRIARGEFPATVRTFVFEDGTIGNYNFLAIPFNARSLPAALVFINHMMSFERVLDLSRVLASPFPHSLERLPVEQRRRAQALERGPATLSLDELTTHFIPEPDAGYLTRFEEDWRKQVLQQ